MSMAFRGALPGPYNRASRRLSLHIEGFAAALNGRSIVFRELTGEPLRCLSPDQAVGSSIAGSWDIVGGLTFTLSDSILCGFSAPVARPKSVSFTWPVPSKRKFWMTDEKWAGTHGI